MEPAASVVTLADASFRLIAIIRDIRSSDEQRHRLLTEINSLWLVLEHVKSQLTDQDSDGSQALTNHIAALDTGGGILHDINELVDELIVRLEDKVGRYDRIKQRLRWVWEEKEFEKLMLRISGLRDSLNLALTSTTTNMLRKIDNRTASIQLSMDKDKLVALLEWLSPYNFVKQQHRLFDAVHQGTGAWLLQTDSFRLWESSKKAILWCPGIPGAGKTYLSAVAAHRLRSRNDENKVAVLTLFLGYTDKDSQSLTFLIAALLKQLVQMYPVLAKDVLQTYESHVLKKTFPNLTDLTGLLRSTLDNFERTFIIIDALDEIREESDSFKLLELLSCDDLGLMITSRPKPSVSNFFSINPLCEVCQKEGSGKLVSCETCTQDKNRCAACFENASTCQEESHSITTRFSATRVDIRASQDDIERYIQSRIDRSPKVLKLVNSNRISRAKIVDTVSTRANGMFLVARFYMDDLASRRQLEDIQEILENSPSAIESTYDQCMQRIQEAKHDDRRFAMNLLLWMIFSIRQLNADELRHAASIGPRMKSLDPEDVLQADELASLCAGLVIIDARGLILFVHLSAQEYLDGAGRKWFENGHGAIARQCMTYMSLKSFESCISPDTTFSLVSDYPLLEYACVAMRLHMELAGATNDLMEVALELLSDKRRTEIMGLILSSFMVIDPGMRERYVEMTAPMVECFFGLEIVFKSLNIVKHFKRSDTASVFHDASEEQKAECRNLFLEQTSLHSFLIRRSLQEQSGRPR